jgi:hypothetical protein
MYIKIGLKVKKWDLSKCQLKPMWKMQHSMFSICCILTILCAPNFLIFCSLFEDLETLKRWSCIILPLESLSECIGAAINIFWLKKWRTKSKIQVHIKHRDNKNMENKSIWKRHIYTRNFTLVCIFLLNGWE